MFEDRLLVWKFKCGSTEAFHRIYEKYESDLLTLAANLLADKYAAEDIVQDVFITFVQSVEKFHLSGSLKGFLATCVANRCRDHLRKSKRERTAAENEVKEIASDEDEPIQLVICTEELQRLSQAIAQVPYEQREVVVLHLNGGLKFRQIADLQKVSVKTALSRYRYGLDKLRSILNIEVEK